MKNEVRNLIRTGKVKKAIAEISSFFEEGDQEIPHELIMLSMRYNTNQSSRNSELISLEQFRREESKIIKGLLDMVDSLNEMQSNSINELNNKEHNGRKCLLFVAGCNLSRDKMDLAGEYLEIRKIFKPFSNKYVVTEEFDSTLDDLFEAIKSDCPDILHFSGLGGVDGIYLVDDDTKESLLIPNDYMASALRMADDNLQCVFISTVDSAHLAQKIAKFVPFAIGAQGMITDLQAIKFSSGFYSSLAITGDYEIAFNSGMKMLKEENKRRMPRQVDPSKIDKEARFFLFKKGEINDAFVPELPDEPSAPK